MIQKQPDLIESLRTYLARIAILFNLFRQLTNTLVLQLQPLSFHANVSQPNCFLSRFPKICLSVNVQGRIFELESFQLLFTFHTRSTYHLESSLRVGSLQPDHHRNFQGAQLACCCDDGLCNHIASSDSYYCQFILIPWEQTYRRRC